jgi:hypothetical protein
VRDAFAAWKVGMPAVVLVHEPFVALARAQFQALGAQDPTMLVYKQDAPALESADEIADKACRVAAEVVKMLSRAST